MQNLAKEFTPKVWPLIIPQINWPAFLGISAEVLNRKVSEHLDLQSQDVRCPSGFLSCLANFEHSKNKEIHESLPWIKRQLTFGFLIQAEPRDVYQLGLDVVASEERNLFVVSATLERWSEALRPISKNIAFRNDIQKQIADLFSLMGIKV